MLAKVWAGISKKVILYCLNSLKGTNKRKGQILAPKETKCLIYYYTGKISPEKLPALLMKAGLKGCTEALICSMLK